MPRDGATIFSNLIGKLDVLYVHCPKCSRAGRYPLQRLIDDRGRNAKVIDWLDEITRDCPKKRTHKMNDQYGARCPDLARGAVASSMSARGHEMAIRELQSTINKRGRSRQADGFELWTRSEG